MLGRLVLFAAVISAIAISAPRLAPALLSAALHAPRQAAGESAVPAAPAERRPLPPLASADQSRDSGRQVALSANAEGHFVAEASIDGSRVPVMVDTGATTIALTDATARRLGLYLARSDYNEHLSTANGVVNGARVTLREVRVGNVALRDVTAIVVPGNALPVDLLGMSFLARLSKFEIAHGQLVLTQ